MLAYTIGTEPEDVNPESANWRQSMTDKKRKPGRPTENVLKIEGNWKDALKTALGRGKPPAKKSAKPKKRR